MTTQTLTTKTTPGFTPYRFAEDYTAAESETLCWETEILADRVFVCVRPHGHPQAYVSHVSRPAHGMVRLHRDPDDTFSKMARELEDELP